MHDGLCQGLIFVKQTDAAAVLECSTKLIEPRTAAQRKMCSVAWFQSTVARGILQEKVFSVM
jgi:hypothetical protein